MSPELTLNHSPIEAALSRRPARRPRGEDLLPLWLSPQEAEAVVQLCAASPAFVGDAAEGALFGKLGQLLGAFQR